MQLVKMGGFDSPTSGYRGCSEACSVVNQRFATTLGTISNAMVGYLDRPVTQPALRALAALLAGRPVRCELAAPSSVVRCPSLATQKNTRLQGCIASRFPGEMAVALEHAQPGRGVTRT